MAEDKRSSEFIHDGYLDFDYPPAGKPLQTYYMIIGSMKDAKRRPLVALHGGPGATLDMMLPFSDLWVGFGIPVILYQQLGAGKSTRIPERDGDKAFFSDELWFQELDNVVNKLGVVDDYDLFGRSWGGMIGAAYVADRTPAGLNKLILSNSPVSIPLHVEGMQQLLKGMSPNHQIAIEKHETSGTFEDCCYRSAISRFYAKHVCRLDPLPIEFQESMNNMVGDYGVHETT